MLWVEGDARTGNATLCANDRRLVYYETQWEDGRDQLFLSGGKEYKDWKTREGHGQGNSDRGHS